MYILDQTRQIVVKVVRYLLVPTSRLNSKYSVEANNRRAELVYSKGITSKKETLEVGKYVYERV